MAPIDSKEISEVRRKNMENFRKKSEPALNFLYATIDNFVANPINRPSQVQSPEVISWRVPITKDMYAGLKDPTHPFAVFAPIEYGQLGWTSFKPIDVTPGQREDVEYFLEIGYDATLR